MEYQSAALPLLNLQLGEAAKRDVGTGENQIPDMSSFGCLLGMPGWAVLPSGLHIRWGNTPTGSATRPVTFATPFPGGVLIVSHFDAGWHTSAPAWGATDRTRNGFTGVTTVANEGGQYIALGY